MSCTEVDATGEVESATEQNQMIIHSEPVTVLPAHEEVVHAEEPVGKQIDRCNNNSTQENQESVAPLELKVTQELKVENTELEEALEASDGERELSQIEHRSDSTFDHQHDAKQCTVEGDDIEEKPKAEASEPCDEAVQNHQEEKVISSISIRLSTPPSRKTEHQDVFTYHQISEQMASEQGSIKTILVERGTARVEAPAQPKIIALRVQSAQVDADSMQARDDHGVNNTNTVEHDQDEHAAECSTPEIAPIKDGVFITNTDDKGESEVCMARESSETENNTESLLQGDDVSIRITVSDASTVTGQFKAIQSLPGHVIAEATRQVQECTKKKKVPTATLR